jgi:hypothetical protein
MEPNIGPYRSEGPMGDAKINCLSIDYFSLEFDFCDHCIYGN